MARRTQSVPPAPAAAYADKMPKTRGRCLSAICVSWKVFTCVFSHVLLVTTVVAYCLLGAKTFEYLEKKNEIEVKRSISLIRGNLTEGIWEMTYNTPVLYEKQWTESVQSKLQAFETDILNSMKVRGWDGNEDPDKLQWTFMGALFYSIIVITTIGYGHIAPKTFMGKISTIFYAILGIPLMLLCLSTIGDIMASSFRFIYWRVCCFVCTREPRRPASRRPRRINGPPGYDAAATVYRLPSANLQLQQQQHQMMQNRYPSAKSNPSMRRSIRISTRTTDSGLGNSYHEPAHMQHAHSDTELRYSDQRSWDRNANSKTLPNRNQLRAGRAAPAAGQREQQHQHKQQQQQQQQIRDRHTVERDRNVARPVHREQQQPTVHESDTPMMNRRRSMMNRRRSMNPSRSYGRSQSMAPESGFERNTMTLPASYGRNRGKERSSGGGGIVGRAQSLDPRDRQPGHRSTATVSMLPFDDTDCKTPVLCNKYAIDELDNGQQHRQPRRQHHQQEPQQHQSHEHGRQLRTASHNKPQHQRCQSMPRQPTTGGRYGQHQPQPIHSPDGMERNRYLDVSQPLDDYYHHKQPLQNMLRGGSVRNYRQPSNHQQLYRHGIHDDDDDDDINGGGVEHLASVVVGGRRNDPRVTGNGIGYGDNGGGDDDDNDNFEMHPIRKHHRRRERQAPPPPSPRIMTPMGFAIHRQARLKSAYNDDDSLYGGDEWGEWGGDWGIDDLPGGSRVRPVPIWLCVFLVVSYIIAGAFLFSSWEGWSFLDSAYFCFITLTTIGFGDFVPAQGVMENPELLIGFCSLYLLFGIALLAMSFNLVQEEVIANVKNVARQLGILKEEDY